MNDILLISPFDFLRDEYRDNRNVAFYSGKAIHYWTEGEKERTSNAISYPSEITENIDVEGIKSKIEWWMPIWYRWIGQVDDYELYRKTCQLYIISLAQTLVELKVSYAIFFTAVSHHVEYSLIEIACQMAGTKQIYLYGTSFGRNARLLPMVQEYSIKDRKVLGFDISNHKALSDLQDYRDNFLLDKPPVHNKKTDSKGRSYYYAALQIFHTSLRRFVKRVLCRKGANRNNFIDHRFDYSQLSLLKIIGKQKKALAYYLSKVVDNNSIDSIIVREGAIPIIFAHYQPEATSFPEGGDYSNHIDVVIKIRKMGYRGTIFYKEHPTSWRYYSDITGVSRVGLYRSIEYYKQLEALGCVFLKTSFKLTEQHIDNLFPVTITGSIGLERSLIGLSTCYAGEPWYKGAPGSFDIYDSFKEGGIFYDPQSWKFDGESGISWLNESISFKTINNYVGIATGIVSCSEDDKHEFLVEFNNMIDKLVKS